MGALRAYEEHARRLRLDLDALPDARLTALAERTRSRLVAAPSAPPQPLVVAILPFTVYGDPALAYLSEGMVDLLATALDGAGGMRPLDPATPLAWLPRADPQAGPLPAPVMSRFGARAVIHGGLIAGGGRLRFTATMSGAADQTLGRVTLERALTLDPGPTGALGRLARIAALEARPADLDTLVTQVLMLSPDQDQALALRALRRTARLRPSHAGHVRRRSWAAGRMSHPAG